jgi:predicted dinucleotide-binding enzyme
MKIAVFGTGPAGRTVAAALASQLHSVSIGTRDPAATLARDDRGPDGDRQTFAQWHAHNAEIRLLTFEEAARDAWLVFNLTAGEAVLAALQAAGKPNLADKVLIDVSNALDFSAGFPPSLSISNTDSLAEVIQREFPETKVVKSLNTVNAALMVNPKALAGGDHTIFLSGDDAGAKEIASDLLRAFGWEDIIDLGELSNARGMEMYLPLWVRLMGTLGTANFNIKVVR